jgi:hypothetical protein
MIVLAFITDQAVLKKILDHLRLPSSDPPGVPSRFGQEEQASTRSHSILTCPPIVVRLETVRLNRFGASYNPVISALSWLFFYQSIYSLIHFLPGAAAALRQRRGLLPAYFRLRRGEASAVKSD